MCNHLVPPSCLFLSTPPQCLYCYIILPPLHLFWVHIYHIWSCSCYIVIQPYFHDILKNRFLLKYIHSWVNILTYAPKRNFANTTWCQKWDSNESRQQYQLLKHLLSSSTIKLHYLQISHNQLTDGQVHFTRPYYLWWEH